MAHLHSTHLSRGQSVVAIAGSTGRLGLEVSCVFLSRSFKPFISRVICMTRNPSSDAAKILLKLGAEICTIPTTSPTIPQGTLLTALTNSLRGVDVVVNILGSGAEDVKETLLEAAINSGVKVYFPSEFGIDWRKNEETFENWNHEAWKEKAAHMERARRLSSQQKSETGDGMKVVALFVGLFLETSIHPMFGFDTAKRVFRCIGPSTVRCAYTSKGDIGRAVAQLSILCMSRSSLAETIPEFVRIAGTINNFNEIKDIWQSRGGQDSFRGDAAITIESVDIPKFRDEVKEGYINGSVKAPASHIRIMMGEGLLDFSDNDNELVNPNESVWKWISFDSTE